MRIPSKNSLEYIDLPDMSKGHLQDSNKTTSVERGIGEGSKVLYIIISIEGLLLRSV